MARPPSRLTRRRDVLLSLVFPAIASLASLFPQAKASAASGFPLVRDGKPIAVIVLADEPLPVARYAAQELAYHVRKASGATLPIVSESALTNAPGSRLYVGDTRAARAAKIDAQTLAPETFVLRTQGDALFIVGGDSAGDPLDRDTFGGTLFGVYEWLERNLGVRWVWPGELGTHVPRARTITARPVNATIAPRFFQRNVRGGLTFASTDHPDLGFTPEAAAQYATEQAVFLRRCRMGRSQRINYGHAFTNWWTKYGKEHPDWFQLVNGKRGPTRPGASYSMCVSNPQLQRKIVDLWRETRAQNPDKPSPYVNACENGIMGLCECDRCRAQDGPTPPDYMAFYTPRHKMTGSHCVTDRYARYWLAVQQEAAKTDPNATVVVYNYFNYYYAPSPSIKLSRQILVGSYPSSGWFPRSPEQQAWFDTQWERWHATGARLFSRGNYCLDGYCMPFIFAHQYADDFRTQVRNGMEATDYDALTGHWATQGPNLYLLMRLHTRPDAPTDSLLAEYYAAFGPAASSVKAYFDYWERYVTDSRDRINRVFDERDASRWRNWAKAAHDAFPDDAFAPAEALLTRAAAAAKKDNKDNEAAARVAFLQAGLTHARLCAQAARLLTLADAEATPERGKKALDELRAFRRAHERDGIANFNHCAWVEEASWKLPASSKG